MISAKSHKICSNSTDTLADLQGCLQSLELVSNGPMFCTRHHILPQIKPSEAQAMLFNRG